LIHSSGFKVNCVTVGQTLAETTSTFIQNCKSFSFILSACVFKRSSSGYILDTSDESKSRLGNSQVSSTEKFEIFIQ